MSGNRVVDLAAYRHYVEDDTADQEQNRLWDAFLAEANLAWEYRDHESLHALTQLIDQLRPRIEIHRR